MSSRHTQGKLSWIYGFVILLLSTVLVFVLCMTATAYADESSTEYSPTEKYSAARVPSMGVS